MFVSYHRRPTPPGSTPEPGSRSSSFSTPSVAHDPLLHETAPGAGSVLEGLRHRSPQHQAMVVFAGSIGLRGVPTPPRQTLGETFKQVLRPLIGKPEPELEFDEPYPWRPTLRAFHHFPELVADITRAPDANADIARLIARRLEQAGIDLPPASASIGKAGYMLLSRDWQQHLADGRLGMRDLLAVLGRLHQIDARARPELASRLEQAIGAGAAELALSNGKAASLLRRAGGQRPVRPDRQEPEPAAHGMAAFRGNVGQLLRMPSISTLPEGLLAAALLKCLRRHISEARQAESGVIGRIQPQIDQALARLPQPLPAGTVGRLRGAADRLERYLQVEAALDIGRRPVPSNGFDTVSPSRARQQVMASVMEAALDPADLAERLASGDPSRLLPPDLARGDASPARAASALRIARETLDVMVDVELLTPAQRDALIDLLHHPLGRAMRPTEAFTG
ncbi:hypothetical protein [Xylophilus sp. GOD-11R]|uniref:hypothetical protein n=1 Tax=Xylophilus sp. GOD-11R TaxID=3089814 RepID=UPI00298C69AE|nr:hypothetical protein [Xylophilus sp. GOD-11R]WPB58800.1 hypothetical protein R9X41_09230 [Xylophilus sp. GOD-11R]